MPNPFDKYDAPSGNPFDQFDEAPAPQPKKGPGVLDRVRAAAAGINRGTFADLLGMPVDAAANVVDLAKAGFGSAALAMGRLDLAPDITERSKVIGTSDWLAKKFNDIGAGGAINNPNPDDAMSRVLHSGGRVAGASVVPNPRATISLPQNLTNMAKGGVGGLAAGATAEVSPEWAGVAGMLPQLASRVGASAVKRAVRGDEAGRRNMEQRMQDLRAGGIDEPSAGLASGNRTVMGIENLLSQTPGSVGLYDLARNKNLAGMKGKADALRDRASTEYGQVSAGDAIQRDLKGQFRDRVNGNTRKLNDKVSEQVGDNFYTLPQNSLDTSARLSALNPGALATSQALQNKRIAGIGRDLAQDSRGTPIVSNSIMNAPTRYRRADGQESDTQPGIPFGTLKNLRTSIGEEAGSQAIMGTPEQAQFKRLYGAMSADMRQAVAGADRRNAGVTVGPLALADQKGSTALNRANNYYSKAMDRSDDLNSIATRATPEGAYGAVASSLNSGPTIYNKLRGAVTPATRQKIVATVIDDLGMATPGQQGAAGDAWSPRTFLTNYNKIDGNARAELFKRIPGGSGMADNLSQIAKTADMLGDASKIWSNPSGTAPALTARATLGGLGVGAIFQPVLAAGTAGSLAVANQASQRLLLNPQFVNWLAKAPPRLRPEQVQAYAQRLIANASMGRDQQYKDDVAEYVSLIEQNKEGE